MLRGNELTKRTEGASARRSQLPQPHFLHQMVRLFLQDEVGALARGEDVLVQVHEVDAVPDRGRGLDRLLVVERRIAVEVGLRIAERGLAQRQKSVDVPARSE